jgi:Ala-tRNA(Pro) deacylase
MSTNTESEWLSWAEKTSPTIANWLDANEISILRLLLNLGATNNANQQKVYAKALLDADLVSVVSRINSAVEANGGYLLSNTYSTVDVRVLTLFYKLSVLFPPTASHVTSSFPHYGKWISYLNAIPAVSSALRADKLLTGGRVREGGMIDLRPTPIIVSALADSSIALNAKEKKDSHHRLPPSDAVSPKANAASAPNVPVTTSSIPVVVEECIIPQPKEANKLKPSRSADERIAEGEAFLTKHSIPYTLARHNPATTVEDLLQALPYVTHPGGRCKNLFVKAKKERPNMPNDSKMWLVIALVDSKVDLKALATKLGYGNIQIRFAEQDVLLENLGTAQGHVSPLSLIHDEAKLVNVALDSGLFSTEFSNLSLFFHPGDNSASVGISQEDLKKVIEKTGHSFVTVDFEKVAQV